MSFRKALILIHLWLGLIAGGILSLIGITGSLYVFEPELSAILEKEHYSTAKESSLFENDIQLATYIENKTEDKIESIQWPKRGRDTYVFKLFDDENWYFFDQSTGLISSGSASFGNSFFAFLLDIHRTLTLGDLGRAITGIASVLFALVMLTTGIYLWWPNNKGRKKSSFKIRWNARPKRLNYDLHNVTGFYLSLPLFFMAITGAYFYFGDEIQWVLDKTTFSEPVEEIFDSNAVHENTEEQRMLTIGEVLAEMDKHYKGYFKRNLWMTKDTKQGTLSLAYQKYVHIHSGADTRIFLKVNPFTGHIISVKDPANLPTGSALSAKWLLPIHFGEFGGIVTRILWFVLGFIPAFLTYTGIKIWLGKGKKRTHKSVILNKAV